MSYAIKAHQSDSGRKATDMKHISVVLLVSFPYKVKCQNFDTNFRFMVGYQYHTAGRQPRQTVKEYYMVTGSHFQEMNSLTEQDKLWILSIKYF
jgi:hypothetical protein